MELITTENIYPDSLKPKEQETFGDELYGLHELIFCSGNKEIFLRYTVFSPARRTKITVYRNTIGRLVGYFAIHHFHLRVAGERAIIMRGEGGFLEEYRHHHSSQRLILKEVVLLRIRHPFAPLYTLSCFISPVMYYVAVKDCYRLYPNRRLTTPERIFTIMQQLSEEFQLAEMDERYPYMRNVGWVVRYSAEKMASLSRTANKDIRFFLEQNPRYHEGYGLLTMMPVTTLNVVLSAINFLLSLLGIKFKFRSKS